MAKAPAKPEAVEGDAPAPKKSKKMLILVIVLVILLLVVGARRSFCFPRTSMRTRGRPPMRTSRSRRR